MYRDWYGLKEIMIMMDIKLADLFISSNIDHLSDLVSLYKSKKEKHDLYVAERNRLSDLVLSENDYPYGSDMDDIRDNLEEKFIRSHKDDYMMDLRCDLHGYLKLVHEKSKESELVKKLVPEIESYDYNKSVEYELKKEYDEIGDSLIDFVSPIFGGDEVAVKVKRIIVHRREMINMIIKMIEAKKSS
jgi:hypothetical protein